MNGYSIDTSPDTLTIRHSFNPNPEGRRGGGPRHQQDTLTIEPREGWEEPGFQVFVQDGELPERTFVSVDLDMEAARAIVDFLAPKVYG